MCPTKNKTFPGVFVALPTPFTGESLNETAFGHHVDWLVQQGIQGVIPCGTTGEALALTPKEQKRLISITQEVCKKKCSVIPGILAPTTDIALHLLDQAQELGCDGALCLTPYSTNTPQEALFEHYQTLHNATDIPLILYNNPGRTGVALGIETVGQLMDLPRIVGLKDACVDLERPGILSVLAAQKDRDDFSLLSGMDTTFLGFLAQGGCGVISVAAGVAPTLFLKLFQMWQNAPAPLIHALWREKVFPLVQALTCAPNPLPIKFANSVLGFGDPQTRFPLGTLKDCHQKQIEYAVKAL